MYLYAICGKPAYLSSQCVDVDGHAGSILSQGIALLTDCCQPALHLAALGVDLCQQHTQHSLTGIRPRGNNS
jgi:hypothetical protein